MKKASIVLLLILFRLFNLSAAQTSSDTLTINAYKTGSSSNTESLILKVYDAVTGSLNSITETDNSEVETAIQVAMQNVAAGADPADELKTVQDVQDAQ